MSAAFTMFGSIIDAAAGMADEDRHSLMDALIFFARDGEIRSDLTPTAQAVFTAIRPIVESSISSHEAGKRGGRPRKSKAPKGEVETLSETPSKPPVKTPGKNPDAPTLFSDPSEPRVEESRVEESRVEESRVGKPIGGCGGDDAPKPKRFAPPTVEEVSAYGRAYCTKQGIDPNRFDADKFVDFYAGKGWKVGRVPMKDWKAACRNSIRDGWTIRDPSEMRRGNGGGQFFSEATRAYDQGGTVLEEIETVGTNA